MRMSNRLLLMSVLGVVLLISGCAPREVVREEETDTFADELREVEKEFDPSAYNYPFRMERTEPAEETPPPVGLPETEEPSSIEYTQGFRIQLYSTSDLEAAQDVYRFADSLYTDHWVYIIYEVPFYKVRVGDFESRPQANRVLVAIVDSGFRDAWVVPDRVLRDPPEKIIGTEEESPDGRPQESRDRNIDPHREE